MGRQQQAYGLLGDPIHLLTDGCQGQPLAAQIRGLLPAHDVGMTATSSVHTCLPVHLQGVTDALINK
jgi:hypothetical protein